MADETFKSLSYKELKEKCVMLGIATNGTKKQLLIALRYHMNIKNKSKSSQKLQTHSKQSTFIKSHKIKPKLSPLPKIKKTRSQSITHNISMINDYDDDDEDLLQHKPKMSLPTTMPKMYNKCISAPVKMPRNTIKMKTLYWNPIPSENIKGSIWEDLNQYIEYDRKQFELHFQVRSRKPMDDEKKSVMPFRQRKKIKIVSKKRGQEILATLCELNINGQELRRILYNMDENIMTLCTLNKLLSIIPTFDEQNKAETFLDTNNLNDEIEIFFYSLSDFYDLEQRIKLWIFKQEFIEIVDGLISEYKIIGQACNKIKNNKNLRLLLSIILSFGNYMNKEKENKINGFNISILCKLREIKSFDNTHSLLMYIYDFCDKNNEYANAIQILPQLNNILKAATSIEMKMLKQIYVMIMDNMNEINELINSKKIENYDKNDRFIIVLVDFYKYAMIKIKQLNEIISINTISMKQCMLYFCYGTDLENNPNSIETFFKIWWQFIIDFGCSKQKLIQLEKERQKRIKKRKKLKDMENKQKLHDKYHRQSTINTELEKINNFHRYKANLHDKLKEVVRQRSNFIENGGKLNAANQKNDTMKRLSTHYQAQVKSAKNVSKILGYDKFIKQTRKRVSNQLQYNNIAPKSRLNSHTNNGFCLPQSSSDILFAQNDEMEDWHSKYIKLEKQCIELKLAQKISDGNNNKLIRQLNEMQKLNEDLLISINMNTNMGVKDKIKFLNKEMNTFCDIFDNNNNDNNNNENNKTDLLKIQKELNELNETNKLFQKTMKNILCNNNNNRIPKANEINYNYEEWDINDMILWIKTLENGRYIKYCNVLQNGFRTDDINNGAQLLILDDQIDLRNEPFNINSIHDRKGLIKHFQSLPTLKLKADK